MTEYLTPAEAVKRIPPGSVVYVQCSAGEPVGLLDALHDDPEAGRDCIFTGFCVPGMNRRDFTTLHPGARAISFFATPESRAALAEGRAEFMPMQYHAMHRYLSGALKIDVALLSLRRNADGSFHHGFGLDSQDAALAQAGLVIAEDNTQMPDAGVAAPVPAARVDIAVAVSHPPPVLALRAPTREMLAVAANVAALIRDGDCIQIGIGALPVAVLAALADKNDLGIHSGMLADGMPALIDSGVATGARKSIDRGVHVVGVPNGSAALYDWMDGRRDIHWRSIGYTHDSAVIGRIDNFVSINGGVEVDLWGQLNAESVKGRQISGVGGSVDFMRGAQRSRGGKSILAMLSTAAGGAQSRIIPALPAHTVATALRTDIDIVVTEHGVAALKNLSVTGRAQALIEIADPGFRAILQEQWRDMIRGVWPI